MFMKAKHVTIQHARCVLLAACAAVIACSSDDREAVNEQKGSLLPEVPTSVAIAPVVPCTLEGIGATGLSADAAVTVMEVSSGRTASTPMPGIDGAMASAGKLARLPRATQPTPSTTSGARSWPGRSTV